MQHRAVAGVGLDEVYVVVFRALDGRAFKLLVVGAPPKRGIKRPDVSRQRAVQKRPRAGRQLLEPPNAGFHFVAVDRQRPAEPSAGPLVEFRVEFASHCVPFRCLLRFASAIVRCSPEIRELRILAARCLPARRTCLGTAACPEQTESSRPDFGGEIRAASAGDASGSSSGLVEQSFPPAPKVAAAR